MNESIRCIPFKIKLFSGPGTRQWTRFDIADISLIMEIRSNAGSRLRVVNISRGGALLWTKRSLIRGTRIKLKVITSEGAIPLSGSVLRSLVFSSNWIPRYQAAVAFDHPLRILDHDSKRAKDVRPAISINPLPFDVFPSESKTSSCDFSQSENGPIGAAFGALNLWTEQYARMREELKQNNW